MRYICCIAALLFLVFTGTIGPHAKRSIVCAQNVQKQRQKKQEAPKHKSYAKHVNARNFNIKRKIRAHKQEPHRKAGLKKQKEHLGALKESIEVRREREAPPMDNPYDFQSEDFDNFEEDARLRAEAAEFDFQQEVAKQLKDQPENVLELPMMLMVGLYFVAFASVFTTCVCCYAETVERQRRIKAGLNDPREKSLGAGSAVRVGRVDDVLRRRFNRSAA